MISFQNFKFQIQSNEQFNQGSYMLPRPSNITSASNSNKSKSLRPISLLSFGIRINSKQQLLSNTSHRDSMNQSKFVQHSALNHQKKYRDQQQMQISKGNRDFINEQGLEMHHENQHFKGQNQKDMFLASYNISKRRIFSDQISQKPHLLKLNNITNMYLDQKQSVKDLIFKNQVPTLVVAQFREDKLFENDIQSKEQKIYVDMKKKIKKISKSKRLINKSQRIQPLNIEVLQSQVLKKRIEMAQHHKKLMNLAYLDSEVIVDSSIFCNKLINHRIDNDIDTDDDQISSGINKLKKSLEEALQQNKNWNFENNKLMKEIQNYQDYSMQEQIQEPNSAYFY